MCSVHYQRWYRHGDPLYVTPEDVRRRLSREAQPRLGKLRRHVYQKYLGRHLHRQVAEKMLGRKLRKGEIVHHKDGNLRNNDPSNLTVMTQSQHVKLHHAAMMRARKRKAGY